MCDIHIYLNIFHFLWLLSLTYFLFPFIFLSCACKMTIFLFLFDSFYLVNLNYPSIQARRTISNGWIIVLLDGNISFCYTPSFFLLYKTNTINIDILTINIKIPTSCKTDLLTGQQFIDLLPSVELLTDGLIFNGSIRHVLMTSQCRC